MTATRETPELTRTRIRALERQYNLSAPQFDELWLAQGGCCALCVKPFGAKRQAHVDHDHRTGYVRGLLCPRCNYEVLGQLGEDWRLYQRVADYLIQAPGDQLNGGAGVQVPDAPPVEVLELM